VQLQATLMVKAVLISLFPEQKSKNKAASSNIYLCNPFYILGPGFLSIKLRQCFFRLVV
jgi:hypothetical protein